MHVLSLVTLKNDLKEWNDCSVEKFPRPLEDRHINEFVQNTTANFC